MSAAAIDQITLNFDPASLLLLNIILGVVTFGIALDLKLSDFRALMEAPKKILVGIVAQFLVLPALTFLLILATEPRASIAMGLILVAACPGGNISNFISSRALGNTALSVTLTAVATLSAIIMTPLNIAFWGALYEPTASIVRQTQLDPLQMAFTVGVLLGIPLVLGMLVNAYRPTWSQSLRKPMQMLSMVIFGLFVVGALAANWSYFMSYAGQIAGLVVAHNAIGLTAGYLLALLAGLAARDRRTITIETGIQNSGLGLVLIINFFDGLGGMAVVAAFWGMWHIISGLAVAQVFRGRAIK